MAVTTARLCKVSQARALEKWGRAAGREGAEDGHRDDGRGSEQDEEHRERDCFGRAAVRAQDLAGGGDHQRVGGRVDPEQKGGEVGDVLDRTKPAR